MTYRSRLAATLGGLALVSVGLAYAAPTDTPITAFLSDNKAIQLRYRDLSGTGAGPFLPETMCVDGSGNPCAFGAGGGGGAATIADGADITQGATADAAVAAGAAGTLSAKLRRLTTDMGAVATNTTGAATASNQATGNASAATTATGVGAPADTAYAGSGNASIIAVLKGIYAGTTGPLPVTAAVDGSASITAGGTAQNLFSGVSPVHGFELTNPNAADDCWFSMTTTAAINGLGSNRLAANGGNYRTAITMSPNHAVSILCPTTGDKVTAVQW